jgi:hypothetical protein
VRSTPWLPLEQGIPHLLKLFQTRLSPAKVMQSSA